MRFAQVQKVAVYILAALGLVALGAGGELPVASVAAVSLGFCASWFAEGALLTSERYTRVWTAALATAFAAQVARMVFLGADPLVALVELAAFLQVNRLASRRDARVYQQITLLSGLMLIAATVLGGGLSYAAAFVGFVIVAPWALTLGHLRREIEGNYLADARAGRAGVPIDVARILRSRRVVGAGLLAGSSLLAVPIFLLTAVIFVLFPRIGLGLFSVRQRPEGVVAGFGSTVELTGHGTIRDNPTIVLRVQPNDLPPQPPAYRPLRLRGAAFDTYTGRGWTRRAQGFERRIDREGMRYPLRRSPDASRDPAWRIVLDPLDPPALFVPEEAVGLHVDARYEAGMPRYVEVFRDRDDGLRYVRSGDESGLVYTVFLGRTREAPRAREVIAARGEAFRARYLQLPDGTSPRVAELARTWAQGQRGALAQAAAIQRALHRFRYTTQLESGRAESPLEDFLFRTRAGHCEYFSTAMAVLLRSLGVPTRNVTGFLGGTYNRYGRFYAVHQGDAHSWVEVWDDGAGWVTFDPTPPGSEVPLRGRGLVRELDAMLEALNLRWRTYIVGFDLSTQADIARSAWRYLERRRPGGARHFGAGASGGGGLRLGSTRLPWRPLVGALLVVFVAGVGVWLLRGGRGAREAVGRRALSAQRRAAVELVRAIDGATTALGQPRPSSRSPLAHAQGLVREGHPAGGTVLDATERYLAARYGAEGLDAAELERWRTTLRTLQRAADRG